MHLRQRAARLTLALAPRLRRFLESGLVGLAGAMSLPRYRVLRRLAVADCRNHELAADAGVRAPTISGLVEPLVRAGWVTRTSDRNDRRAVVLHLTATGRRALRATEQTLARHVEALFAEIDGQTLGVLVAALERMSAQLAEGAADERAGGAVARRRTRRRGRVSGV
jgi:DNA-binding MarR family transcriptional regulator